MTRWRQTVSVVWPLAAAAFILLIGIGFAGRVDRLEKTDGAQQNVIDELSVGYDVMQEQNPQASLPTPEEIAEDVAEENDVDVDSIGPSPAGPQGERGDAGPIGPSGPGPTPEQIDDAVASYCASRNGCVGAVGADAGAPTQAQLVAAVAAYCGIEECVGPQGGIGPVGPTPSVIPGPAGPAGADGQDGTNGTNGAPGRPPTADEVAAAVADYCATGACTGPAGGNGLDGTPAPAPTQEQINTAVTDYCTLNGCVGPAGPAGADGAAGREPIGATAHCPAAPLIPEPFDCPVELVYS